MIRSMVNAARALLLAVIAICAPPVESLAQSEIPATQHARAGGDAGTPQAFDSAAALKYSQAALGGQIGDYTLTGVDGRPVRLSSYRGKPLVVSLVYTSCYHTCSVTTRQLAKVVRTARQALGPRSFAVLTIGFDTSMDTPMAMRNFQRQQGVDMEDWAFLSADSKTIQGLGKDLGFLYSPSPKGFDHLLQSTVIDADGKVYRQVYGDLFVTPALVEPLKDLVFGTRSEQSTLESLLSRVRLFCTAYDPSSDRYYFDYSLFIGMAIGASIVGLGIAFLVRETLRSRRAA